MEEKHMKHGDETRRMEACTAVGCVKGCVKHEWKRRVKRVTMVQRSEGKATAVDPDDKIKRLDKMFEGKKEIMLSPLDVVR